MSGGNVHRRKSPSEELSVGGKVRRRNCPSEEKSGSPLRYTVITNLKI